MQIFETNFQMRKFYETIVSVAIWVPFVNDRSTLTGEGVKECQKEMGCSIKFCKTKQRGFFASKRLQFYSFN